MTMRLQKITDDDLLSTTLDRSVREMHQLCTGREIPTDRPLELADLNVPITDDLIRRLAYMALSTVVFHARRGSLKAAQILLDRALGMPEQPFVVKVQQMTLDDCKVGLLEELERSGIRGPMALQLAERLINGDEA